MPLRTRTFLIVCAVILLPLCLLGYGSDNDIFTVLDAGRSTWHLHVADTSRNPGYWAFEALVYVLARLGAFAATNIATLAVGLVVVWRFLTIADRLGVRFPLLIAAALVATPAFAIACTSTEDYVWSLLGVVLFAEMLIAGWLGLAVLVGAFAFAIRGANGVVLAGAIAGALTLPVVCGHRVSRAALRIVGVGVAAALLGGLPYVASYRLAHHSFAFTEAVAGPVAMWTTGMRVGRFFYKGVYLFGPLGWVVLLVASVARWRQTRTVDSVPPTHRDEALRWMGHGDSVGYRKSAVPVFLGIVISNALLFLKYPIEISYLLPGAFFFLLVIGMTVLANSRLLAAAFLLAVLSLNVVTPQAVQPNVPGRATAARWHPALWDGVLVEDIRLRRQLEDCDSYSCYYLHFHPGGHGLDYSGPPAPEPSR